MASDQRAEIERIATQLRRAYEGPSWHGPAVKEALAGISAEQAQQRHGVAHTIIELVLHIAAWKTIVRSRVLGEPAQEIAPEINWPTPQAGATEQRAWDAALARLENSQQDLLEVVNGLDDTRLNELLANTPWTIYDLLHGVVQHDLYHSGQVALLKKL